MHGSWRSRTPRAAAAAIVGGFLLLAAGGCSAGAPAAEQPWFMQQESVGGSGGDAAPESGGVGTAPEPAPRVLVVGDSYTAGHGVPSGDSWAWLACRDLGWECVIDGVGGTGYLRKSADDPAGTAFGARLDDWSTRLAFPVDKVVLQGGLNDWRYSTVEIREAVADTVAETKRRFPHADVMVVGLTAPVAQNETRLMNAAAVAAGARAAGAEFIDPLGPHPWIDAENSAGYDLGDGLHVNRAGHRHLADRFVAAVQAFDETRSTDVTAEAGAD